MDLGEDQGSKATVDVEETDGEVVVRLAGELDLSNASLLEEAIAPAVRRSARRAVVFELARLQFMDSSVLAVMLRIAGRGITVRLRSPSAIIREVIEATGLDSVLLIEP
ncbi:MAG TPA: STAS domain-containing protein [Acidimicrobiales bacterium]|nr:STAS domain-containing protein [Acidimicrobiales bacterium]